MSVRSKVAAAAVPEAAAARKLTPGTSAKDANAEMQRRRREAADRAAARRSGASSDTSSTEPKPATEDASASPAPAASSASSPSSSLDAVHTGGGFVLGFLAWVVFVNYMQGGVPQVRKLAAAKFLNKTGG